MFPQKEENDAEKWRVKFKQNGTEKFAFGRLSYTQQFLFPK